MEKIKVTRAVVVEGKYDKIKLSSLIDGLILQTDGFRIYRDKEKAAMIRAVAKKQGLIVLTDSDRAGFQLRGYLRSITQGAEVAHIYIPRVAGKESRKTAPGAEGILGVEGIDGDTLRELFRREGLLGEPVKRENPVTRLDFYEDGLTGGKDSSRRRKELLRRLNLPEYMTAGALLEIINSLMSREEYRAAVDESGKD